jgi:hypothetical protein
MTDQPSKEQPLAQEYADIIKEAQKQPGIIELSKAYGYYDLLMKQSSIYLKGIRPKFVVINSAAQTF